ncbi:MAG: MarR family transcriptional regulator [Caldisphaera sp.]|jgi:Mn-dependent DtxR family transcriptional regulator|nr:MarR family transcriptional regulator [Caldisphaera sp.]PMP90183.1 MAG: hypothetical protein C0171_05670 [Caldisphaera sp.]
MSEESLKITLDLKKVMQDLYKLNKKYVTLKEFSKNLGTSTRSAGKILKKLEKNGYVKRYSSSAYLILWNTSKEETNHY